MQDKYGKMHVLDIQKRASFFLISLVCSANVDILDVLDIQKRASFFSISWVCSADVNISISWMLSPQLLRFLAALLKSMGADYCTGSYEAMLTEAATFASFRVISTLLALV